MMTNRNLLLSLLALAVSAGLHAQTITAVAAVAGPASALCPGDLAIISGANLGGAGAGVNVGSKAAAVLGPQGNQLVIQIPIDAPTGPTTVTVGASAPFNITLAPNLLRAFRSTP